MKHDQTLELQRAERTAQIMDAKNEKLRRLVKALTRIEELQVENDELRKQLTDLEERRSKQ
jgi:uncharacterized membrane protein